MILTDPSTVNTGLVPIFLSLLLSEVLTVIFLLIRHHMRITVQTYSIPSTPGQIQ